MPDDAIARGNPASPGFRLDDYPFYLIARVDHAYAEQMQQALHRIGMSRPRWRVLLTLREASPRSMSELARITSAKLSTLSRVVERLREDGLVTCAPRAADNRVTEVYLADGGRRALEEVVRVAARQYERALAGVAPAEVAAFVDVLRRIRVNLERSPLD